MILKKIFRKLPSIILLFFLWATTSCTKSKKESQVELFRTYCAACHMAPAIDALPKVFLKDRVLPAMAARMGIRDSANDPSKGCR